MTAPPSAGVGGVRGAPVMFDHTKCGGKNRGIRKVDRGFHRYTVYDNRTDDLVILDGTAEECARLMKITVPSFYSAVTRARNGKVKRWHIEIVPAETLLSG